MEKTKTILMTSGVAIAIITSGSSIVKELIHERASAQQRADTNADLHDSFKLTADTVNDIKFDLGRLEGRIEALEQHSTAAPEARPKKAAKRRGKVLQLGSIDVQGKVGAGAGASAPPAPPPSAPAAAASFTGADSQISIEGLVGFNAPPPQSIEKPEAVPAQLNDDLDSALKQERAKPPSSTRTAVSPSPSPQSP
jgi:hypothetical protein